uniref:Uncharacterized protein n=1 Tax=Rhizophora mucronata TaxID=61149 RepID=A0A2P2P6U9_RHIMU
MTTTTDHGMLKMTPEQVIQPRGKHGYAYKLKQKLAFPVHKTPRSDS